MKFGQVFYRYPKNSMLNKISQIQKIYDHPYMRYLTEANL